MPADFLEHFRKTEANDEPHLIGTPQRGSERDTVKACRSIEVN